MRYILHLVTQGHRIDKNLISRIILSPGTKHFTHTILQSTEDLKIDYRWQVAAEQSVAVLKAAKQ